MIIYEVNLVIDKDVSESFMKWLKPHVVKILSLDGFLSSEFLEQTSDLQEEKYYLTMQYRLVSMDKLNDYLANHADAMRNDGLEKFPNKFVATRRVFLSKEKLSNNLTQFST